MDTIEKIKLLFQRYHEQLDDRCLRQYKHTDEEVEEFLTSLYLLVKKLDLDRLEKLKVNIKSFTITAPGDELMFEINRWLEIYYRSALIDEILL